MRATRFSRTRVAVADARHAASASLPGGQREAERALRTARCRARRRPGRRAGVGYSAVVIGTSRAASRRRRRSPARSRTTSSRRSSSGDRARRARRASGRPVRDQRRRRLASARAPVRRAGLVGDDAQLVALGGEPAHRQQEILAAQPVDPARAQHERARAGRGDRALARELARAVDVERAGRRVLVVGRRRACRRTRSRSSSGRAARRRASLPRRGLPGARALTANGERRARVSARSTAV